MNRRQVIKTVAAAVAASLTPISALSQAYWPMGGSIASAAQGFRSLGMNLNGITYFTAEQPFLNLIKMGSPRGNGTQGWITSSNSTYDTNEEAWLNLDANGYPTTLEVSPAPAGGQQFAYLQLTVNYADNSVMYAWPAGSYTFMWEGKGTLVFLGDATIPTQTTQSGVTISGNTVTSTNAVGTVNSIALNVTPNAGITIQITALPDSSNNLQTWSLVQSAQLENYLSGGIFRPELLAILKNFGTLRFMDWENTNNQVQPITLTAPVGANVSTVSLASAWVRPTGSYRFSFDQGDVIVGTIAVGQTTVTLASNTTSAGSSTTAYYNKQYQNWASRPTPSVVSYGGVAGCPYDICIDLANQTACNPWLTIPIDMPDADVAQLATLIFNTLSVSQKVYIELSNEIWNGGTFAQAGYALMRGKVLWPTGNDFQRQLNWQGVRTAQIAQIFESVFGSAFASRVCITVGAQIGNANYTATQVLTTPLWTQAAWTQGISACHGAPYIGDWDPTSGSQVETDINTILAQADPLSALFDTFTSNVINGITLPSVPASGWLGNVENEIAVLASTIQGISPTLKMLGYESGQQFYAGGDSSWSNRAACIALFDSANRDARMGAAYTSLYDYWMAQPGSSWINHFVDAATYGQPFGDFGALESIYEAYTPASPPKWAALIQFMNANRIWWN